MKKPTLRWCRIFNSYLQMASTRLAAVPNPGGKGARNSLLLYLAMMKRSLSSCEEWASGLGPFNFCSQILLAIRLPRADMTAKCPGGHSSRSNERTLDMCVPNFRWTPEHSMQMRTPRLMLAQSGSKMKTLWSLGTLNFLTKKTYVEHHSQHIDYCLECQTWEFWWLANPWLRFVGHFCFC